ncbi:MAG: helicase, partial [Pseudomonadota bacterium]
DKTSKERHPRFRINLALAVSVGLEEENARRLLGSAGFRLQRARALPESAQGPAAPDSWTWRPRRPGDKPQRSGRPDQRRGKGRENAKNGKRGSKRNQREKPRDKKPDAGPARASGAFDGLADLLGG